MSTFISYDDALDELKDLKASGKLTKESLFKLASRVSVEAGSGRFQGAVALFLGWLILRKIHLVFLLLKPGTPVHKGMLNAYNSLINFKAFRMVGDG